MRWCILLCPVPIMDILTHDGADKTLYMLFRYVPPSKYTSLIPLFAFCVVSCVNDTLFIVNINSPRAPSVVYVFTSSLILPTNLKGFSTSQKNEFIPFLRNVFFTMSLFKPPTKSPLVRNRLFSRLVF